MELLADALPVVLLVVGGGFRAGHFRGPADDAHPPALLCEVGEDMEGGEQLLAWCKSNLAGYKVPRHVVFVELPKTSTGKIQKFKLREMAKAV